MIIAGGNMNNLAARRQTQNIQHRCCNGVISPKHLAVRIGTFTTDTATNQTSFEQVHHGIIVEDLRAGTGGTGEKGDKGDKGDPGETGPAGADGITYTPSLREETGDNYTTGGVFLDFTPSDGGEVIRGAIDIRGPKGDSGDGTTATGETVASWAVRQNESGTWQIFKPIWVAGDTHESMYGGWINLANKITTGSGEVWACGEFQVYYEDPYDTENNTIFNGLARIYLLNCTADELPAEESFDPDNRESYGVHTVCVPIGRWNPYTGEWEQYHLGVIVEDYHYDLPTESEAPAEAYLYKPAVKSTGNGAWDSGNRTERYLQWTLQKVDPSAVGTAFEDLTPIRGEKGQAGDYVVPEVVDNSDVTGDGGIYLELYRYDGETQTKQELLFRTPNLKGDKGETPTELPYYYPAMSTLEDGSVKLYFTASWDSSVQTSAYDVRGPKGEDGGVWTPSFITETGTGAIKLVLTSPDQTQTITSGDLRGRDGAPGAQGETGPAGADGAPGADGITYTPCLREVAGNNYTQAAVYVDFTPSNGGATLTGTVNIKGEQGEQGEAGEKGEQGETGPAGPDGITYTPSLRSDSGGNVYLDFTRGNDGTVIAGTINIKGAQGPRGSAGDEGPEGAIGPAGPAGKDAIIYEPILKRTEPATGASSMWPALNVMWVPQNGGDTIYCEDANQNLLQRPWEPTLSYTAIVGATDASGQQYYDVSLSWIHDIGGTIKCNAPINGPRGATGPAGKDGADGEDGADGKEGLGWTITAATNVDDDGNQISGSGAEDPYYRLTFTPTTSDGATFTTPNLLGKGAILGNPKTLQVVTDVRYDVTSHSLQKKVQEIKYYGPDVTVTTPQWQTIEGGQAVPHSELVP